MYIYIFIFAQEREDMSDFWLFVFGSLGSPKPALTSAVNFEIASSVVLKHSLASIHLCQAKLKEKIIKKIMPVASKWLWELIDSPILEATYTQFV